MDKKISYLNRTFNDYRNALIGFSKKYYPDLNVTYNDASVASWMIDLNASIADNLSYHIDRVYQETNLNSAQERSSLLNIARGCGVKIPGPKGSMAEVRFYCILPTSAGGDSPDYTYAPIIKRGTKLSSANQIFEVMEDIDFAEQFNSNGVSDRTYKPNRNTNNIITGYTVTKLSVVVAGESRVFRQTINTSDVKPFMEIVIPYKNVMNIESVLVIDGQEVMEVPTYGAFYSEVEECDGAARFFEVDSLACSERWGASIDQSTKKALRYKYGYSSDGSAGSTTYCITKGEWKPVRHKFITEYTDNGFMKLIFGAGTDTTFNTLNEADSMSDFSKWQISRTMNNDFLGVLPNGESTMFVLYRVGGGASSNVAEGAINRISYLNAEYRGSSQDVVNTIKKSFRVRNTTPSVCGKDAPSNDELRNFIKYNKASQERCVTPKDYVDRILNLPPKYGTPFRVGASEENNKIMVYVLGLNQNGNLDSNVPVTLIKNIERYLSHYRMINDFVEIKSGRIINLEFEADIIIDKNYNSSDVVSKVITVIKNYMDINSHMMGEEIYVGDLEKEISKVDGVVNLIELSVYNITSNGYSSTQISQPIEEFDGDGSSIITENIQKIDLSATDGILYNDGDCMMEIKNPSINIRIRVKEK